MKPRQIAMGAGAGWPPPAWCCSATARRPGGSPRRWRAAARACRRAAAAPQGPAPPSRKPAVAILAPGAARDPDRRRRGPFRRRGAGRVRPARTGTRRRRRRRRAAAAAAAAAAPPLPFTFIGKSVADGAWEVYLARGDAPMSCAQDRHRRHLPRRRDRAAADDPDLPAAEPGSTAQYWSIRLMASHLNTCGPGRAAAALADAAPWRLRRRKWPTATGATCRPGPGRSRPAEVPGGGGGRSGQRPVPAAYLVARDRATRAARPGRARAGRGRKPDLRGAGLPPRAGARPAERARPRRPAPLERRCAARASCWTPPRRTSNKGDVRTGQAEAQRHADRAPRQREGAPDAARGATRPRRRRRIGPGAAYKQPISIEFRDAPLKQVFEVISRRSGLNFVFDKDVKTDQRTSIFLKNSTVESASTSCC
jgi:hypothetical protein